jgi:hypothetical protein
MEINMSSFHRAPRAAATQFHSTPKWSVSWWVVMLFLCLGSARILAGSPVDVPSASAGMGPCTADFTVVDSSNKPVFDAKVHLKVKYGFLSKRDTDLEIGTNSDGKAHITGLPIKLKKPPLVYTVQSGGLTETVTNDPAADCHANFDVTLGSK